MELQGGRIKGQTELWEIYIDIALLTGKNFVRPVIILGYLLDNSWTNFSRTLEDVDKYLEGSVSLWKEYC